MAAKKKTSFIGTRRQVETIIGAAASTDDVVAARPKRQCTETKDESNRPILQILYYSAVIVGCCCAERVDSSRPLVDDGNGQLVEERKALSSPLI